MATMAELRNQVRAAVYGEGVDNKYSAGHPLVKDTLQLAYRRITGDEIEGGIAEIRFELLSAAGGDPDKFAMGAPFQKADLTKIVSELGMEVTQ